MFGVNPVTGHCFRWIDAVRLPLFLLVEGLWCGKVVPTQEAGVFVLLREKSTTTTLRQRVAGTVYTLPFVKVIPWCTSSVGSM